jgi:hypothetical protein
MAPVPAPARRITAIVVNYNGEPFIADALTSLLRQRRPPDQIIVVDNASTDGSIERIRRDFPTVELIQAASNLGFTGGNNLAAAHARGDFLALLNSDAVADPGWLEVLAATLESNPTAAATVGKIYESDRPRHIEQAGALFNNLGNYWGRGFAELDEGQFDEPCEVAGLTCCATLIRRDALRGEPLFDEGLFMYGEELDLTIRLRANGYTILYTPAAVVHHGGMKSLRATQKAPRLFQQSLANRNRLKLLAKYYPARLLARGAPLIALGLLYWDLVFLFGSGPRALAAFLRDQVVAIRLGLRERNAVTLRASERWLPWMTRHTLRGLLRQMRTMRRAA